MMTIAQYSFKLGVLSTPSKIVRGAGAPPAPLFRRLCCSIRVYRSFKQVFKGPFVGPPGAPFRLGPRAKCPSCPPPPWAALLSMWIWGGLEASPSPPPPPPPPHTYKKMSKKISF